MRTASFVDGILFCKSLEDSFQASEQAVVSARSVVHEHGKQICDLQLALQGLGGKLFAVAVCRTVELQKALFRCRKRTGG